MNKFLDGISLQEIENYKLAYLDKHCVWEKIVLSFPIHVKEEDIGLVVRHVRAVIKSHMESLPEHEAVSGSIEVVLECREAQEKVLVHLYIEGCYGLCEETLCRLVHRVITLVKPAIDVVVDMQTRDSSGFSFESHQIDQEKLKRQIFQERNALKG